ncbi:MAG: ATP-binding protein [Pseudomonadota bacterium]
MPPAHRSEPACNEALPAMIDFVIQQATAAGLAEHHLFQVELAAEEILTNIIKYAYPDQRGDMAVACEAGPDGFWMEFSDQGPPFNPLAVAEPPLDAPVSERQVGGLGLFLVRRFMDRVEYLRQDGRNVLRILKSNRAPAGG